jgi:hypothetical protein
MSSYVFSFNGPHLLTGNSIDTTTVEFNIMELDTTLVSIPLFNIENANAIFVYQSNKISDYKSLVVELDSVSTDKSNALSFCQTALKSSENINLNLEKKCEEKDLLLVNYRRVNRISISLIVLLLAGLSLK